MSIIDNDFIGFTFNGKHSIDDLHIYRVSNGDRYDETSNRALRDQIVDLSGQDGGLWLDSFYKAKHFKISFAYDNLKKEDIEKIKNTFDGKGVHTLIFDEYPYKFYNAKVENKVTLQYICFEENGEDVYKGEGQVNFICYDPYGYSSVFIKKEENLKKNWDAGQTYEIECGFWLPQGEYYLKTGKVTLSNFEFILNDSKVQANGTSLNLSKVSFLNKVIVPIGSTLSNTTLNLYLDDKNLGEAYSHKNSNTEELNELSAIWSKNENREEFIATLYLLINTTELRMYPEYNLSAAAIPVKIVGESLEKGDKISIADMWCELDEGCDKCYWDTDTGAVYTEIETENEKSKKVIKSHGRLQGNVKVNDSLQPSLQKAPDSNEECKISLQYQLRYY